MSIFLKLRRLSRSTKEEELVRRSEASFGALFAIHYIHPYTLIHSYTLIYTHTLIHSYTLIYTHTVRSGCIEFHNALMKL